MVERKFLGGLLIIISLFIAYRAYIIFTSWQYRNKRVLGVVEITPFIEIAVAILVGVIGVWLLLKRRK